MRSATMAARWPTAMAAVRPVPWSLDGTALTMECGAFASVWNNEILIAVSISFSYLLFYFFL
jgi:hypothetical protein